MYLHVGGDLVVAARDVIAILDGRAAADSEINEEFVRRSRRGLQAPGHSAVGAGARGGRSWVVTSDGVYVSGLSPATLARRMARLAQHAVSWMAETPDRTRRLRV